MPNYPNEVCKCLKNIKTAISNIENNSPETIVSPELPNELCEALDGIKDAIVNGNFGGSPNIEALSVTENGTYSASGDVDGYSPITVNVSGGGNFSIVNVTFRATVFPDFDIPENVYINTPVIDNNKYAPIEYEYNGSKTVGIVLYNNRVEVPASFTDIAYDGNDYDMSGNVTYDDDNFVFIITGDCTFGIGYGK